MYSLAYIDIVDTWLIFILMVDRHRVADIRFEYRLIANSPIKFRLLKT